MKKTLLSLTMLTSIGIYSSQAQITINAGDIVDVGDVVEQAKDTIPGAITIGSGGASQTWNFSTINQDRLDTLSFKNPVPMPGSSNFPLSNVGMEDTGQDSTWMFLTKNASGLFVDGLYQIQQGQGSAIPFIGTIITFPSTMGTNYAGGWNGTLVSIPVGQDLDGPGPQGVIDSIKITRDAYATSNIDGWGNVTTPFGTFASLRQIVNEESIDTTWQLEAGNWSIISASSLATLAILGINLTDIAYDTTRTARWWTDDPTARFPLVEMDYEANGQVNEIAWQKSTPTVGVNKIVAANAVANQYPNPAKDVITIEYSLENNSRIDVLDVTGHLILSNKFATNKITLSLSNLSNGVYFYNIYDVNGAVLHTNKFVVTK